MTKITGLSMLALGALVVAIIAFNNFSNTSNSIALFASIFHSVIFGRLLVDIFDSIKEIKQ